MNKRQKLVQQAFINDEEKILQSLKNIYNQATEDITKKSKELQEQIKDIQSLIDNTDDEKELERLKSMHQSKVYQKQYQDALKKQIGGILDNMQVEEFKTVSAYLNKCYEEAFLGTLYDIQGQGMPIMFPIDQQAMVQAVQLDSKISNGLYSSIGENVAELKKTITSEVSRGIANGATFPQIAKQIQSRMTGVYTNKTGGALYRAELIARTEGHRIQCQSTMNACYEAKDRGADVVKQWDATLDGLTRPSHRQVDGEIKELDEKFSNGLMFPGDPSGGAAEVCNCRCALLERARWAINAGFTKMNNFTKQLETFESPEDYNEFKKAFFSKENRAFMNYHTDLEKQYGTKNFEKLLGSMTDEKYKKYMELYGKSPIYNKNAGKVQKATFTPAKSVEEAEKYAGKFAKNVNYGKMTVAKCNEVNATLEELTSKYPITQLEVIKADSKLKSIASANYHHIYISPSNIGSGKYKTQWEKCIEDTKTKISYYKNRLKTENLSNGARRNIENIVQALEEDVKYSRFGVPDMYGVKGTISHEFGHILADQHIGQINGAMANPEYSQFIYNPLYRKQQMINDVFRKAKQNGDIYSISQYAAKNSHEFFAECFAMREMGETPPDYIVEMLDKVLKNDVL